MAQSAVIGFPRMGKMRELKKSLESYWKGDATVEQLHACAKLIRVENWQSMKSQNIDFIPSNDFSLYDQVLDMSCLLGNVPSRFGHTNGNVLETTYFLAARGKSLEPAKIADTPASELTKWFDTNYHFMVPEFESAEKKFTISSNKVFDEYVEAKNELGIETRPVLIGPVTYLSLGKCTTGMGQQDFNVFEKLLQSLLKCYEDILLKLYGLGCRFVQVDEPILGLDLTAEQKQALTSVYNDFFLQKLPKDLELHLVTYFSGLAQNSELAASLAAVSVIHVDCTYGNEAEVVQMANLIANNSSGKKKISLGLVNGRNIWINNYAKSLTLVQEVLTAFQGNFESIIIASSCSMLHSPVSLAPETELDSEIKQWMSFAVEKLVEIKHLTAFANGTGDRSIQEENAERILSRQRSARVNDAAVQQRLAGVTRKDFCRPSPHPQRIVEQQKHLKLPFFPTTTIGSFPQTVEVRKARAQFKKKDISEEKYIDFCKNAIAECVKYQDDLGLDVLVHGEFERNDMVEYFGEHMQGFCFTQYAWVQSYGSRCVKPPIIFGDVSRPTPITVSWSSFAQTCTKKPMKAMLTGPVTILKWSFVRDDQPLPTTANQIALAIRDEVCDLEAAGIKIIQVDEAAFREAMPLRQTQWQNYLTWAVDAFRLASCGVRDDTQIHTHMCYSEFNQIISSIAAMDADVLSIETSRSNMELLDAFAKFKYPNQVGPGVYDIHSPAIPTREHMEHLLLLASKVVSAKNLWVNPDCGLKTRQWDEVKPSLAAMVAAASSVRLQLEAVSGGR